MCLKNKLTWVDDGSGVTEILYGDADMLYLAMLQRP
jgi:hypothetical protein